MVVVAMTPVLFGMKTAMRLAEIKVFKPNSKQADYTIYHMRPEEAVKKLGSELNMDAASKARSAFRSLKRLGAESLVFRDSGRKIKVQVAA